MTKKHRKSLNEWFRHIHDVDADSRGSLTPRSSKPMTELKAVSSSLPDGRPKLCHES